MNKLKLKSGREVSIKEIGLDDRDDMLDGLEYIYDDKGEFKGFVKMHGTITKWLRIGLNGKSDDEYILGLSMEERTEIFIHMQEGLHLGKGKASSSK